MENRKPNSNRDKNADEPKQVTEIYDTLSIFSFIRIQSANWRKPIDEHVNVALAICRPTSRPRRTGGALKPPFGQISGGRREWQDSGGTASRQPDKAYGSEHANGRNAPSNPHS